VENYKTIPVSFTITVSDTTGGPIFLAADTSNYSIITSKQIQFEPSVIHNIASGVPQAVQVTINTSYVAGPVTISITAFDSGNLSDTQSFSFNIIDAPNIPDSERQFLIDLRNSTYLNVYDSWQKQPRHTDNFSMPGTECMWEGITCYNGGNYILAIDLPKKNARGRLPDSISNLTHLKSLNLADNQINSIPDTISALTELESINFNNNYLSNSEFLSSLKQLQNLTTIQLARCNLESSDISSFSELTQLQYLDISNNSFQGKIFDILSNLSHLKTLIISNNNFGGQLPDNFSLTSLQTLDASNNQFWGNIPSGIQQLANLTHLNFSKNTLTGAIPNEIANLAQLKSLKIDRNQLIGDIPENLMNLTQLQDNASDFSYNALYTSNSQLSSFLDLKQIGDSWSETQTLPVTDLTTGSITDKSITLFWAQVSDTFPNGGLEISYAKTGESFAPIYPLIPKLDQEFTVNGLLPGTQYQFRIRNCTDSHYENNNKIYSEYSTTVTATTTGTSPTLNDYIEEGRQYLRNATLDSVILANKSFENALAIQSDHEESKLFHALTRFAPLLDIDKSYTAGMPIENVKELLDVYGIDQNGRDIDNWFADFKRDNEWNKTVLEDSPSPAEIQAYIQSVWISEIDAALNELETISENFNLKLEKQEICDECKEDIEVDYAEILLFKSMLNLVKTAAYISISYDIDANPKEILDKMYADIINVHADILDKYTTLFTTLADAQTYMDQNARTAFILAIDQYFEASDFIRAETDDQTDDLLSFDQADAGLSTDEQKFRAFLSDLRQSLEERVLLYVGAVDETWEFVNDKDQKLIASLEFSNQGLFGSGAYVSSRVAEYGNNEFLGFSGNITDFIVDNNIVTITFNANSWRECNRSECYYSWHSTYCYGSGSFTGNISSGNDRIYNGTYTVTDCEGTRTGTFNASRVSMTEETYNANIGEFFADPISFRNHFPDVKHDPYTNELHVNGISTIKDRTYSGLYPDRFPIDHNGAYIDTFFIQGTSDSDALSRLVQSIDNYFFSFGLPKSELSDLSNIDKILIYKYLINIYSTRYDYEEDFVDDYFGNAKYYLSRIENDELLRFTDMMNNRPVFYVQFHDLDIHDIRTIIIEGPYNVHFDDYYWRRIPFGGKVDIDPKTTTIGPNSELVINSIDFLGEGKYKIILKDYSGNTYETSRYFISNPLDTFTEPDISPENHAYIDLPGSFHWQPIQNDKIDTLYYRVVIYTKNKSCFYPIYISERSTETFVTLPDYTIQPDSVYYFQIEALDGSHDINTHNIVRSQMRSFFTGTKTLPLTINQFAIEAQTNPIDAQTLIKCQISGALPDDLTGIALSGPAYYTLPIADAVISENAWYIWQKNRIIPDGNYNLSITDSRNNESVSANASFVYNELPTTDIISAQKFIATTTPTLKWAAIPDGTYYYTAEILDPYSRTLYTSSISTDTQAIIPENILEENQLYQWRVNVYDSPSGGQNSGVTLHKNLYIKTTAQPVITLSGPGHVSENTGVLTNAILVKLSTAPQTDLTLKLTSSDTSEITVQPTLIIPAGQTWGQFDISVLDDSELDNTQGAGINAAADGWLSGNLLIEVYDNEMSADDYVQQGRQLIRDYSYQNVLDANASFYAALQIEPNHDLANFLYAISRLAAIVDMKAAYTPGTPLETLNEIADAYGVASTGRNIPNWTAGIYVGENGRAQVPEDCPSPQAVVNYFNHAFMDQVNGALDNLARIDQSFAFIVTQEEMGTDDMDDTEVDYGEVLLYRTALYGLKSALLIATAYNYDVPDVQLIIDKVADDIFDWKKDIYDKYAQLAMLATGGDTQLSEDAKTAMLNMIDSYFDASEFIRNEADDQSDDLLSIDLTSDGQLTDESHFRDYLLEVKQALVSSSLLTAERTDQIWKFRNEQYQEIYLNVSWLLNDIFDGGSYYAHRYGYPYNSNYGWNEFLGLFGDVSEFTVDGNNLSVSLVAIPWQECEYNDYYGNCYPRHCEGNGLLTGKISPSKDRIYDTQYTITDCEGTRTGTFKAELVDQTSEKFTANPGEFFDDPIHPREYAPEVKKDPYSDRAHIDGYSTFPDRTYSGVYPERYPEDHNGALIDKFYIHATSDPKIMTKMENYLDMYFQSRNVYESDLSDLSFSDKLLMFNFVESQYGNRWDFESNYSSYFNNVKSDLQNINDDQRALNSELFSRIPLLKATFSGLDVNDIVSANVSGPVNRFEIRWYNAFTLSKAAIDMASQSEISNRSELVIWHPGLLGNGKYTITLTDSNGDSYTQHRILTLNPLDNFNEQAIFPESESSITLPQTFSWQPITDETIQDIYYQITIYLKDNQEFVPVYTSPRTTETYATLENLKPDTQYYWQVEAFDGSHDINSHNMVCSTKRTFYTGSISTLNIDDFILQSNILPDQDQSIVKVQLSGALPKDLTAISITGPINITIGNTDKAKMDENGWYQWSFIGLFVNGTYTVSVTDMRTNTPVEKQFTFTFQHVPCAQIISAQKYIHTTTPVLKWENDPNLYFSIEIFNAAGKSIYTSPKNTATEIQVPQQLLEINQGYTWQVHSYLSDNDLQNQSSTNLMPIFILKASPKLTLNGPSNVIESDGTKSMTLTLSEIQSAPVTVKITSSDTSEIQPLASTTIPSGTKEVHFDITMIDDAETDGTQLVGIHARADHLDDASFAIHVYDNDISADDYVASGKKDIWKYTPQSVLDAHTAFAAALGLSQNHEQANLFYAISRLAVLLDPNAPYTPGLPIDAPAELMDLCGVSSDGRDLLDWSADFYCDADDNILLNDTCPSPQAVIDYLQNIWITEIDGALDNLSRISSTFNMMVTQEEIGSDTMDDVEIDYGEILLYRAALVAIKANILVLSAYDYDVQSVAMLVSQMNQDLFNINTSLLDRYESLFTLISGKEPQISDNAKNTLLLAIDTYFEAYAFITSETDDQTNDLMAFDDEKPKYESDEKSFRDHLTALQASLNNGNLLQVGSKEHLWELSTTDNLGGGIQLRIKTDAYDNFDSGSWSPNDYNSQSDSFIGYGGYLDDMILTNDNIQMAIQTWMWNDYNMSSCEIDLQFQGNTLLGYMEGTYTGTVCGESKTGTFEGNYLEQKQDIKEFAVGEFFNDPVNARAFAPKLTQDPYTDDILINGLRTYPDRTYSDVYPAGAPDDIILDSVGVYSINSEAVPTYVMVSVRVNELAPWMIDHININFNEFEQVSLTPVTLFFDPDTSVYASNYSQTALNNDTFWIDLYDKSGTGHDFKKSFTYNEMPMAELISPVQNEYVDTTTPTFSWQSVMDDKLGNRVFYKVVIFSSDHQYLYCSDVLQTNEFTMPPDVLADNTSYLYRIIVMDSPDSVSMNNLSISSSQIFFTGASQTMTIEQAGMMNIVNHDESTIMTRLKLKLSGIIKTDIQSIQMSGPENRSFDIYSMNFTDLPDGAFYWDTTEMPSGAYTISVIDGRNSDTVSTQLTFSASTMERPTNLGMTDKSTITTTMPTLTWDLVSGISSYQVQILDLQGRVVYESPVISQTQFIVPENILKMYEAYQWQVLALDKDTSPQNIAQSERRRFYVSRMNNYLSLSLPSVVNESDGSISAEISVPENLIENLTVQLTVDPSNTNIITIPTSATIETNSQSVQFQIQINDNSTADGDQQIKITASAPAYIAAHQELTIIDDETSFDVEERTALIALYNSTNGDNWTDNSGWNGAEGTECTWYGITCMDDHITHIYLGNNNLTGSLPSEISGLKWLIELNLNTNTISGELPAETGALTNLEMLDLSNNQITGSIPDALSTLTTLYQLNLSHNDISGSIPESLFTLSNLSQLDLSHNHLSGSLPNNFGNLSSLFAFNISANKIQGVIPTGITNLQQLYDSQSDLKYNALYSNDSDVIDFLNSLWSSNEWQIYQTIAPSNISQDDVATNHVQLKWDTVSNMADGGYEIWYSTSENGPYTLGMATNSISENTGKVENLNADTLYYFTVRTWTNSHVNNKNRVDSSFSPWIEVRTAHVEEYPPVIATLPWQTISKGYEFASINLNSLVSDADHDSTEINWYASGQSNLSIDINDGVAAITILETEWIGSETITFTAVDPTGLSDSQSVELAVIEKAHCQTAFRIPDSGQKKCYDNAGNEISCPQPGEPFYGQDGNYLINEQSYTKLDEQGNDLSDDAQEWVMVRDNVTGLIWEIKTAKDDVPDYSNVRDADNKYKWYDSNPETNKGNSGYFNKGQNTEAFIKTLNAQSFGGFSDWRLPSQQELRSIVNASKYYHTIDTDLFLNAMSAFYWSSTSRAGDTGGAWGVHFRHGYDGNGAKDSSYFVRAVRGGQCGLFDDLVINSDGTVTDTTSGFMWQQEAPSTVKSWPEALSYCENLDLGNYSDWRLPEKGTLGSITDLNQFYPAINSSVFFGNLSAFYWSSTSTADGTGYAWGVYFYDGYDSINAKDSSYFVRAVRGGQNWLFGHLFIWSPAQASSWQSGETMPINWDTQNIAGNVTISLSRQGGKDGTFETLATTENDGEYNWTVAGESSVNCMLKIEPVNEPDKGTQQSLFTIIGDPASTERNALLSLYNNTNGDNWTDKSNWNGDPGTECTWFGIQCDNNQIIGINMFDNNLVGTIPAGIFSLTQLQKLDLSENHLTGSISQNIANLSQLTELNLSSNELSGELPSGFYQLTQLEIANLSDNQLTGEISPDIANLTKLIELILNHNQFSGELPSEITQLTSLEMLYLMHNQFGGHIPGDIGNLTQLIGLDVSSNAIIGSIPESIVNLTNLNEIYTSFDFNALRAYTQAADFMDTHFPGWLDTQTIAPSGMKMDASTSTSITLSWDPIKFQLGDGGYEIWYQINGTTGITPGPKTGSKSETSLTVENLQSGTLYTFFIATWTESHTNNQNRVRCILYTALHVSTDSSQSPPVIATIPWQTISKGYEFAPINLNYLVSDAEHAYTEMSWQVFGQNNLSININDGVAAITILDANWTGSETITFTAIDPTGLTDSKSVELAVIEKAHCQTAFRIPDSGQRKCYNNDYGNEISCPQPGEPFYGQDGNYLINEQSYTKLDEQGNDLPDDAQEWVMVRDNVTGLIWEIKTEKDDAEDYSSLHDADNKYMWYDSNPETNGGHSGYFNNGQNTEAYIRDLNLKSFGGFSDWRLPSQHELLSIVTMNMNPAIDTNMFPNAKSDIYFSSTNHHYNHSWSSWLWVVNFENGNISSCERNSVYYIRAVRGGNTKTTDHLYDNNDGTITDIANGLMWEKEIVSARPWADALSYCESLTLADYSDWRLPDKLSLQSIIDYSHYYPAINSSFFSVVPILDSNSGIYWTSTSYPLRTDMAFSVFFSVGYEGYRRKDSSFYVRSVRGGQNYLQTHLFIWTPMQASIWQSGETMPIKWDTQNIAGNVTISLSRQGGKDGTFETLATTENDGEYNWTVAGESSVNCMLKIEPVNEPDKGTQQSFFVISGGSSTHPVITTIPDQTITIDETFAPIPLDNYVSDMDHAITEITWQVTGQSKLQVNINNRIAEITFSPGWTGFERLVFTATDPDGLTSSTTTSFEMQKLYLYLSMPESAIESAGTIQGAVYVKKTLSSDLQINLTSSDTTEIQVPATVTISAGHSSVDFDCTIINDTDADGAQEIYIRATADGCDSAGHRTTIRDDEVSADTLVAEGRQFLSNHTHDDIFNAHSAFEAAISKDANHAEANFFIAATRLLNLLNTDELNDLLTSYGVSETGRDIYNWTADFQHDPHGDIELPENSPTFDTVQSWLLNHFIPEIDAALANLSKIDNSFATIITNDESGDYLDDPVEIDYGDILAFKLSLHALKSVIYIVCAYDLNADMDEIFEMLEEEIFDINDDLLDQYQNFLNLVTDGEIMISDNAKTEMLAAINLYFETSAFIRSEQDDQSDDFLQIDNDMDHDETEFQENLVKIEQSINETKPVTIGEIETDIETSWYIMMEPDSGSQHSASWWVITDEFNTLKHSDYYFHSSCIDFSHGCYGEIVTYEKSDDLLTVLAVSSDGTSITYTGRLTADESAIVSGTYIATYYDYNGKNTVTGTFSGSKEYSDTRVEDNTLTVNAGEIFNDPIDIRSYLPELATDPYTHDILIVSESSFPDRTFSGILPDKWPTKGDVYIDKVRVLGIRSQSFYPSYLELCINGLASWDIKEIMVSGPGFWPVTFSPIQISSDILSNDQLYVKLNEQSYDGDYHFSVTDNNGHTYEQTKHFTRNNIFVSEDSVIPESNAFVETTTPTFVLPDLSQSNSGDMNAGLIAYYPLDGNADDFSVYSNNGIINGSVPFSQGAIGSCAYFNGEYSNYIRIPHQTWLNFSNAFSISLWINAESESRTVLAKGRDIYSHYRIDSYGKSFSVNYTDDYSDRVSVYCDTAQFNLHTWYHVVCIADNNTSSLKYYLNGQRVKQVDLEKDFNITTTYDLVIGRHDTTNDGGSAWPYPFNGYVDDIRIYNRALSDNDVQGIYQNWSGNATNQVPLYYNISIWEPFKYQSGRKLIYRTITSNNQWTVPENILSENQFYSWDLYVQDAPDIDVANNVQGIVQDRLFHTGADDTVTIKKVNIQSRQSSKGIETLIDLGTMFWTSGTSISITGPINTIIQDQTYGHAYTVVSGIIPDGIYDFSISEAGKTEAYTKNYQFKSISIAQNLTIISRNEKDYVFTTIPVFSWSPVINNGIIYHSNLQIFEEDSPNYYDGQLVYESPISLKTQATIPANILKANNAYRYRVMVYDSPTDAQNVSVTDFQRFYIKMTDPALMLTIPTSVNEKDGILAQQGAVFLNTAPVKDVVITLTSIDPSEIKVPAQLIIPKGQMSAAFNIQVIDDDELDNDQTAIVKATAIGWEPCSASITVIDDDEDWKTIDLPFPSDHITFHAMWGTSDDNIFVVGSPATIVHYDGTNWETMALPDNIQEYYDLFDIHGTDENNIIAVGSHTTVLKYDGSQWQSLTSNESGFMLNSVWTSGENIYAAGDKYLALENGQWQERSDTYAPFYSIWGTVETEDAGYTNTYLYATSDYRIVKQRIGDNSFTPESQELHNTFQSIFGIDNVIYAVGDDEIMLKDKGQWTEIETSAQQEGDRYFGLWTSAHNDILLCGIHGTIINMVDSEWKRMQTGTQNNLFDIWGSSEKDVYAVGESGTILRARPRNVVVNHPPNKPVAVTPVHESTLKESFDTVALESGSFSDPDGDQHYKTIWRVRRADQDYYRPGYAESFNTEIKNAGTAEMTHHTINDLMSGMKYYWQVGYMDDSDGLSGISWSDEHSFKIGNETTDENPPTVLPGEKIEDYRMISFPYWMKDPNILSTIQLDTINTETNKIGTYLPSRGGYIEGNSLQIEPGRAYWFLSRKGLDLAITGVQVNMSEIIEVPLWYNPSTGNGWNMIGAPNNKTYLWAVISIIVYDDLGNIVAGPYNVLSEEAGKYIDSRLWEWEDGTYEDNEEEIRPYEGYWVKAKALHVSLQFPVDGFANNAIKNKSFVRWLKELVNWVTPSSLQATSDTPPMPMGLSGGVEVSEDKCFIGVLEIK
jgi:Leucine-rich repeat (LRR) protein